MSFLKLMEAQIDLIHPSRTAKMHTTFNRFQKVFSTEEQFFLQSGTS